LRILDKEIFKKAWKIAWPLMIAESINSILWITDTFFVSKLGYLAIASVGLAGYISWLLFTIGYMMYMGSLVVVSQAWGAGLIKKAEKVSGEAFVLNIIISIPIIVSGITFAKPLLRLLGASSQLVDLGFDYIKARIIGLMPIYGALVLDSVFRAIGITKPVLHATLISAIANAVLDPLLIYGLGPFPKLGVAGAGYASALASAAYLLTLSYSFLKAPMRPRPGLPSKEAIKTIKIGLPYLAEELAMVSGQLSYIGSITRCGSKALAAHTIGVRIESIAFLPLDSFAIAGGSLVGQEIGADREKRAEMIGWEVSKANGILGVIVGMILVLFGRHFALIFSKELSVIKLTTIYLIIAGLTEPPLAFAMALAQAIRNAGNTLVPTTINILSLFLLRVLPAYFLPQYFPRNICVVGAWLAMALDVGSRGMIFTILYKTLFTRLHRKVV